MSGMHAELVGAMSENSRKLQKIPVELRQDFKIY